MNVNEFSQYNPTYEEIGQSSKHINLDRWPHHLEELDGEAI